MSKSTDMLSSVVRAAVGVPQDRLDTLAKLASKFGIQGPLGRPEGEVWHSYLRKILEERLPDWAYLLNVSVRINELGEFYANYGETATQKLQSDRARQLIRGGEFQNAFPHLDGGMFKATERTGVVRYRAYAVNFNKPLTKNVIDEWGRKDKKIMAGPREGIDFAVATPLFKLASALPLVMFGECRYDSQEFSYVPCFLGSESHVHLGLRKFDAGNNPTLWSSDWKYLALEELQPTD